MKKSVIKELFYGERTFETLKGTECDNSIKYSYEELKKVLNPQQLELHNKYMSKRELAFVEDADNHYVEGFKLGMLIAIECLQR